MRWYLLQFLFFFCVIQTPVALEAQEVSLVKVPNLVGRQLAVARQTLRLLEMKGQQGVFFIAPQSWRNDIAIGVIQMQTPLPRMLLPEGGAVAFWTFAKASEDAKVVKTPDVRKLSRAEAVKKLRDVGLTLMRADVETGEPGQGEMVEDQYPRPGQEVLEATSVYLKCRR